MPGASPRDFSNRPFTIETIQEAWPSLVEQLGNLGSHVNRLRPASLPEPGVLAVAVPGIYNWAADACDTIEARGRIESALRALLGRSLTIRFDREQPATESEPAKGGSSPPAPQSGGVRPEDLADDPLVQDVLKLFEARPVRLEADDGSGS